MAAGSIRGSRFMFLASPFFGNAMRKDFDRLGNWGHAHVLPNSTLHARKHGYLVQELDGPWLGIGRTGSMDPLRGKYRKVQNPPP